MPDYTAENLLRLMADQGLSIHQVVENTELDERTIRGILNATTRPRARSLHQLAKGLGVSVDEFFLDPSQLLYRCLDHAANPLVEKLMQTEPKLFAGWTKLDYDSLLDHIATSNAPRSRKHVVGAIREMNQKRELHGKLDLLLDSNQAETTVGILEVLCRQIES